MVKTIHVTLDDEVYNEIKAVKDELGVTWEEFMVEASKSLAHSDT